MRGEAPMTPKLSIITACYNHGQYLAECISSVRGQTETDIEHIVVIDGATDNSEAVALSALEMVPNLKVWINKENRGLAASQNIGIEYARAPWVLKVDADDKIHPSYVEEILRAAADDPRRNVIFSPCQHFGAKTHIYRYPAFDYARMMQQFMIPGPAAFRKELWAIVGGYDESMRSAEDWDLYIRAQIAVGLVPHQLPEPRWYYRMHSGPRASAEGIKRLAELQHYWRGHTRKTVMERSRSWGAWCAERNAVPA
jgi:glycosyltransferase involved in cell wall biosynthesis